jgi:protein-L-isoaspartate(D-aspartate) O-methyltransferase
MANHKLRLFLFIVIFPLFSCAQDADPFFAKRNRMVQNQIADRGITDEKVLEAFRQVERHKFVLPEYIPYAYNDSPLPIIEGQTISQPYIVAFMTDVLNLKKTDKVLEIGTGSGYQAAILAEICDSVFTIEIFETLGKRSRELFDQLGYTNIFTK